jgi:hypothetical protein
MGVYKPITGGHHPEWGTCSVQAMFSAMISARPWRSSFHKENRPGMNNEDLEFGLFGSTTWLDRQGSFCVFVSSKLGDTKF